MGGGAMHVDLPMIQFNSSSSSSAKQNKTKSGSVDNFVLGPVPSKPEVEKAVAALQKPELRWLAEGIGRAYNSFNLLLKEPSVKRLVVALSSDKDFWDAIMNNELVRKLWVLPQHAVENPKHWSPDNEEDLGKYILQWILDMTKATVTELVLKFQSLLNEVFGTAKAEDEGNRDQVEEKIRSSLLLSIVILLVVVVARVQRV